VAKDSSAHKVIVGKVVDGSVFGWTTSSGGQDVRVLNRDVYKSALEKANDTYTTIVNKSRDIDRKSRG